MMTNNKEYQLIRDIPQPKPKGKLEWFFRTMIAVITIGYLLSMMIDKNLPWDIFAILMVIMLVIFFGLLWAIKFKKNKPYSFLKIQDNKLYIATKNATLWCKPITEIVDIAVVEPKIKWKIVLKSKSLIFKTKNDSYDLDLQYSKFDGYSVDDVVKELKDICNLNA